MKNFINNSEQLFTKSDIVIVEGLKRITVFYQFLEDRLPVQL